MSETSGDCQTSWRHWRVLSRACTNTCHVSDRHMTPYRFQHGNRIHEIHNICLCHDSANLCVYPMQPLHISSADLSVKIMIKYSVCPSKDQEWPSAFFSKVLPLVKTVRLRFELQRAHAHRGFQLHGSCKVPAFELRWRRPWPDKKQIVNTLDLFVFLHCFSTHLKSPGF